MLYPANLIPFVLEMFLTFVTESNLFLKSYKIFATENSLWRML